MFAWGPQRVEDCASQLQSNTKDFEVLARALSVCVLTCNFWS